MAELDRLEQLDKESIQSGEDLLAQGLTDALEDVEDGFAPQRFFFESELRLGGHVHVHGLARIHGTDGALTEFCAVFRQADIKGSDRFNKQVVPADGDAAKGGDSEVWEPVPIDSGEFVKVPERVVNVSIPFEMWLQTLDDCPCFGVDSPQPTFFFSGCHRPVSEDWKLKGVGNRVGNRVGTVMFDGKVIDQGVERCPKRVEDVADDESQVLGRIFCVEPNRVFRAIRLWFEPDSIAATFLPQGKLLFEGAGLFACPQKSVLKDPHALSSVSDD